MEGRFALVDSIAAACIESTNVAKLSGSVNLQEDRATLPTYPYSLQEFVFVFLPDMLTAGISSFAPLYTVIHAFSDFLDFPGVCVNNKKN